MDAAAAKQRLARIVKARRVEKGLSRRRAAELAEIDRATWTAVEVGNRSVRNYNHARIERVLGWAPGSIEAILAGDEPTDRKPTTTIDFGALPPVTQSLQMDLEYIKHMEAPAAYKLKLLHWVFGLHRQAEAERRQAGAAGTEGSTAGDGA